MVGMTILIVAIGGVMSSILSGAKLGQSNRETARAHLAARAAIEQLWTTEFLETFRTFNDDPEDDPDGPGTASGSGFAVYGLDLQTDDADGLAGRIEFPTADGLPPGVLREDIEDPFFGMPRDLDSDNNILQENLALSYTLLPVRVVVEWRGAGGTAHFVELETLLSDR